MKRSLAILMVLAVCPGYAQEVLITYQVDPVAVALGEAEVARYGSPTAWETNPASLAGISGITLRYANRDWEYWSPLNEAQHYGVRANVQLPLGAVGIAYERRIVRDIEIWDGTTLEKVAQGDSRERMLEVAFGANVTESIAAGLTVRAYDNGLVDVTPAEYASSMTPACVVDVGLLYHVRRAHVSGVLHDTFCAGLVLRNFGSDLTARYFGIASGTGSQSLRLDRFLGIGCSYEVKVSGGGLMEFSTQVSAGYLNLLNPGKYETAMRDHWIVAIEVRLFKILAVRAGGHAYPNEGIFGTKGQLAARYGIGLVAPVEYLGAPIPISVGFDCAWVPLMSGYLLEKKKATTTVLGLHCTYREPLW